MPVLNVCLRENKYVIIIIIIIIIIIYSLSTIHMNHQNTHSHTTYSLNTSHILISKFWAYDLFYQD